MHELIYYPGFEVLDRDWLKFALLYIDKLKPIIPYGCEFYLSDEFKEFMRRTDLVDAYRPSYDEGDSATRDALEEMEKIMRHPERYGRVFGDPDFLGKWTQKRKQTATLFRGKFTEPWERFCIKHNLAHESQHGLHISIDVSNLYMTILAQCVSDSKRTSPITDRRRLDRFSIFTRRGHEPECETIDTAQGTFDLALPADIGELSIDRFIEHRNRNGFRKKQQAFHQELNDFMDNYAGDATPIRFIESLGSAWQDFSDDIAQIGTGVTAFGLGVWLLIESDMASVDEAAKEIAGGLSLTVGSTIAIRNTWKHTKTKRYTRKFLADLKRMKPA